MLPTLPNWQICTEFVCPERRAGCLSNVFLSCVLIVKSDSASITILLDQPQRRAFQVLILFLFFDNFSTLIQTKTLKESWGRFLSPVALVLACQDFEYVQIHETKFMEDCWELPTVLWLWWGWRNGSSACQSPAGPTPACHSLPCWQSYLPVQFCLRMHIVCP